MLLTSHFRIFHPRFSDAQAPVTLPSPDPLTGKKELHKNNANFIKNNRTVEDGNVKRTSIKLIIAKEKIRKLRCILDFERSRNQRQGSEFFLGKWTL